MSKLKCPACKTDLSKPLPERCPVCNLEGINRMFLTREDYDHWKTTVLDEHIKKLRNHRVSVGHDGVLVLLGDGRLFGFGHNTQGQYCPRRIGEKIDTPEKIAANVISAAAGYNYSLYLDANGKVHFLGNSGIPYKERFDQGNLVFKEVFASNVADKFWAIDKDDKVYFWGEVGKRKERLLKIFDPIKIQYSHIVELYYETGRVVHDKTYHEYHNLDNMIKETEEYKSFKEHYGECNLEIFPRVIEDHYKEIEYAESYDEPRSGGPYRYIDESASALIQPEIYFINRYIFLPVEPTYDISFDYNIIPNACNRDLNASYPLSNLLEAEFKKSPLKKSITLWSDSQLWACLGEDGKCFIGFRYIDKGWKNNNYGIIGEGIVKFLEIDNIADCSSANFYDHNGWYACVSYFIDHSKKLWRLDTKKLEHFTVIRDKKYSHDELLSLVYEF